MAFPMKTQMSCISLRENNLVLTSTIILALLAYQRGDTERCFHGDNSFSKRILHVLTYAPIRLCNSVRAAVASHNPFTYVRNLCRVLYRQRWHLLTPSQPPTTYPTKEAEQRYWDSAERFRRKLQSSDARFHSNSKPILINEYENRIPMISSFQPALPPLGNPRKSANVRIEWNQNRDASRPYEYYYLPTKAFSKWHRMTYPDQAPLDRLYAERLKSTYNNDEKREIHRISRLISNKKAFRVDDNLLNCRRYQYRDMWDAWQEKHSSSDVEVLFGAECHKPSTPLHSNICTLARSTLPSPPVRSAWPLLRKIRPLHWSSVYIPIRELL
ncbi:hypothetical protein BDP27DRAFT_1362333 [Rhodocollybia butyracea]|uniref:Uncharacterized protein n=1 Tax=Rhodocollybia butyracea TaxID=206335 RepID=A0A9P5PZ73_9AGAR|nr:hypothetical protein BDP27DRAFT_1362333 [Rhodocollybia butyracea]